ncbi:MAG: hypothetical protein KDC71_22335 [Acidobacteria bacterium]|nr:hypothetical protein [Acidobacteriota bacterium]
MKKTVWFGAGLIFGVAASGTFFHMWESKQETLRKQEEARYFLGSLADQAITATQIYEGNAKEKADLILSRVPEWIDSLESNPYAEGFSKSAAMWSVEDLYLASGQPIPQNIKNILDHLPPRPPCNIRARTGQ